MQIGYYGELDPFTGSIPNSRRGLIRLVRDLKVMLMVFDIVIVPPGNLLEHRMTLPAFEILAPFVQAGMLTTSVSPEAPPPISFLHERAHQVLESDVFTGNTGRQGRGHRSRVASALRRDVAEVLGRWEAILPGAWSLRRDVGRQVEGFSEVVRRQSLQSKYATAGGQLLADQVDAVEQRSGRAAARPELWAMLAAHRDDMPATSLRHLSLLVQTTFFYMGAQIHESPHGGRRAGLFPGAFAELIQGWVALEKGVPRPPYAMLAEPMALSRELGRLGLNLRELLNIHPRELFAVVVSEEWQRIRQSLEQPVPIEVRKDALHVARRSASVQEAVLHVGVVLAAAEGAAMAPALMVSVRPPAIILPARWQLAVQSTLAPSLADRAEVQTDALDLTTGMMRFRGSSVRLAPHGAHLVAALIIAGVIGLRVRDLQWFMLDEDRLDAAQQVDMKPPVMGTRRAASYLNRVNVAKARLNRPLREIGLAIEMGRGRARWRLAVHETSQAASMAIRGSIWRAGGDDVAELDSSLKLPPQLEQLYVALWRAGPRTVSVQALCSALGKVVDARGTKQTSDALCKLRRKLMEADAPVVLRRVARGVWGLFPRPPPAAQRAAGEVR